MSCIPPKARTFDDFTIERQVGSGSYGNVYRARDNNNGNLVALKLLTQLEGDCQGFLMTSIREIKSLRLLQHKNVIRLHEIITGNENTTYMVLEFVDHDLEGLISMNPHRRIEYAQIKCFAYQMLDGLAYIHSQDIIHRDLKPPNILVTRDGCIKICDFGLSRSMNDFKNYTNKVVTIWYRSPELLFGATAYNQAIDLWSMGIIITELLLHSSLFPGKTDREQLELIFSRCGPPDAWNTFSALPLWDSAWTSNKYTRTLCTFMRQKRIESDAIDFVDRFLRVDPSQRISASDALKSQWFNRNPLPCYVNRFDYVDNHQHMTLDSFGSSCHQYEAKQKRQLEGAKVPSKKIVS